MHRFQLIFERSETAQIVGTADGVFSKVNAATGRLFGAAPHELVGQPFVSLAHPDDAPMIEAAIESLRGGAPSARLRPRGLRRDGSTLWLDVAASTVIEEEGAAPLIHATLSDLTEHVRTEQVMQARFGLTQFADDHSLEQILIKTLDMVGEITESPIGFYHFVEADQRTLSMQAWSTSTTRHFCTASAEGRHYRLEEAGVWADAVRLRAPIIHNDYSSLLNRRGMPAGHATVRRELVVPILRRDKIVAILGVGNKPRDYVQSDVDLVAYFADVVWEIASRKLAEDSARTLQERARQMFENQGVGQALITADGRLLQVNRALCRLLGYDLDTLHRVSVFDVVLALDRPLVERALSTLAESPEAETATQRVEVRCATRDGRERVVELTLTLLHEQARQSIATFVDVTERRDAEAELRLLHTAVEQSPASVVITDRHGGIQYVNEKFCQVSGYTREEARGQNPRVLKSGLTSVATYQELWATVSRGEVWRGQLCNKSKSGALYWENVSISPVRPNDGPPTHFIAVKEDVTAQRALEVQLIQAQKLEAVGHLAAGIAHEINTPTQFASDSVRFLDEALSDLIALVDAQAAVIDAPDRAEALAALEEAKERADLEYVRAHGPKAVALSVEGLSRIASIVRAMKDFSHPDQGVKAPADLNAALQSTLAIARNEYKYVADVVRDLGVLPPVTCLVGELNQVFLNLIVNAAHAIADVVGTSGAKGVIGVCTRDEGGSVVVEISDTGVGVADEDRLRIFDPFFTTKAVGRGTGQGLTIARSIVVNKHGGELTFESERGRGSTFRVRLPVERREATVHP